MSSITKIVSPQTPAAIVERTWRATIDTPKGGQYQLSIHRETYAADADGKMIGEPTRAGDYVVMYKDILDESVTFLVDGKPLTLKVSDLGEALRKYFDQKVEELKIPPKMDPFIPSSPYSPKPKEEEIDAGATT
jgi:hypothetical protein